MISAILCQQLRETLTNTPHTTFSTNISSVTNFKNILPNKTVGLLELSILGCDPLVVTSVEHNATRQVWKVEKCCQLTEPG